MIDKKNFGKLEELWKTIEDRAHTSSPEESYVSSLLSKGLKECAKKLGEEGVETSLAALSMNKKGIIAVIIFWSFFIGLPVAYMSEPELTISVISIGSLLIVLVLFSKVIYEEFRT